MQRSSFLPLALANRLQWRLALWFAWLLARASGQGLVEYGLILTLVMVVVVGIVTLLGQTVSGLWYQRIIDAVNNVVP